MINSKKTETLLDQINNKMQMPMTVTHYRTNAMRIPRAFQSLNSIAASLEEQYQVLTEETLTPGVSRIHNVNPFNYNKPSPAFDTLIIAARRAEREAINDSD